MAKHSEVFSDAACAVLGFSVVHQSMRNEHLHKLKLVESPPTVRIVPILQKTPPQDEATARKWFEYLAGRLGGMQYDAPPRLLVELLTGCYRFRSNPNTATLDDAFCSGRNGRET